MKSMTGFGRATLSLPNHLVTLEVSVAKGLEIVFRSQGMAGFRTAANSFVKKSVERGRIRISILVEQSKIDVNSQALRQDLVEEDLNELRNFMEERG